MLSHACVFYQHRCQPNHPPLCMCTQLPRPVQRLVPLHNASTHYFVQSITFITPFICATLAAVSITLFVTVIIIICEYIYFATNLPICIHIYAWCMRKSNFLAVLLLPAFIIFILSAYQVGKQQTTQWTGQAVGQKSIMTLLCDTAWFVVICRWCLSQLSLLKAVVVVLAATQHLFVFWRLISFLVPDGGWLDGLHQPLVWRAWTGAQTQTILYKDFSFSVWKNVKVVTLTTYLENMMHLRLHIKDKLVFSVFMFVLVEIYVLSSCTIFIENKLATIALLINFLKSNLCRFP